MKISEAARPYILATCNTSQSKVTYRSLLQRLQDHVGPIDMKDVTLTQLGEFCIVGDVAPGTVRLRRSIVQSFFEWAQFHGMVDTNPASGLRHVVKAVGGGVREHHWLDQDQMAVILQSCTDDAAGRRDRLICLFGVLMGLRRSEIAALRWPQFSSDLSRLTLIGKGRKLATLGVPPQVRDELTRWRAEAPAGSTTVLPTLRATSWASETSGPDWECPIGRDAVYKVICRTSKRSGVALTPHDMRRSYLGVLLEKGIPIQDASQLMRHNNIGTTDRYAKKDPRRTAAMADTITCSL